MKKHFEYTIVANYKANAENVTAMVEDTVEKIIKDEKDTKQDFFKIDFFEDDAKLYPLGETYISYIVEGGIFRGKISTFASSDGGAFQLFFNVWLDENTLSRESVALIDDEVVDHYKNFFFQNQ